MFLKAVSLAFALNQSVGTTTATKLYQIMTPVQQTIVDTMNFPEVSKDKLNPSGVIMSCKQLLESRVVDWSGHVRAHPEVFSIVGVLAIINLYIEDGQAILTESGASQEVLDNFQIWLMSGGDDALPEFVKKLQRKSNSGKISPEDESIFQALLGAQILRNGADLFKVLEHLFRKECQ